MAFYELTKKVPIGARCGCNKPVMMGRGALVRLPVTLGNAMVSRGEARKITKAPDDAKKMEKAKSALDKAKVAQAKIDHARMPKTKTKAQKDKEISEKLDLVNDKLDKLEKKKN